MLIIYNISFLIIPSNNLKNYIGYFITCLLTYLSCSFVIPVLSKICPLLELKIMLFIIVLNQSNIFLNNSKYYTGFSITCLITYLIRSFVIFLTSKISPLLELKHLLFVIALNQLNNHALIIKIILDILFHVCWHLNFSFVFPVL